MCWSWTAAGWEDKGESSSKSLLLLSEGKLGTITPDELAEWSSLAESKPRKFFFYGCNTAKSGFVRDLSEMVARSEVTGTGNRVAPYDTHGSHRTIAGDRDHHITFKGGNEINNVRKVDINWPFSRAEMLEKGVPLRKGALLRGDNGQIEQ